MRQRWPWAGLSISIVALSMAVQPDVRAVKAVDEGCPQTSSKTAHNGTTLQGFASTGTGGVIYDSVDKTLQLKKEGGIFSSRFFASTGTPQYTCAADFDKDGWMDFAAATSDGRYFGFYRNRTFDNILLFPLDWLNASYVLPPLFALLGASYFYTAPTASSGGGAAACGDFNGDGKQDFAVVLEDGDNGGPATFAQMFLGKGNGTFNAPYNLTSNWSNDFKDIYWDGNMVATDYNGDNRVDLLFGAYDAGGGFVRVFLNNGAASPTFTPSTYLVQNAGLGAQGVQAVAWADFTNDGRKDLAISGKGSDKIKIYPGLAGGGVSTTPQTITALSQTAILLAADFSLDGKVDLISATDGNSGQIRYFKNSATSTPFSSTVYTTITETFSDFDTGFFFNYDNDPENTPDLMLADGNGAGYATFTNRVVSTYVACADVASGILDLGSLANKEMVVTAARLKPVSNLPTGTSINYYMSNEDPPVWQLATQCVGSTTDYCVSFPSSSGRSVRWKATMCSNSGKTATPKLSDVTINFDYTLAEEHFRGGVVVDDGVAYFGAFKQPGDRGRFYAANAGLDQVYWEAGAKLDAMSDSARKIYTAVTTTRLAFETGSASQSALQTALGVTSSSEASALITWQRSSRFGLEGGGHSKTRLGAVETSTPAILAPPGRPPWYQYLSTQQKQEASAFVSTYQNRPVLALFGSKDGPLHAVLNDPSDINDSDNGKEMWAYIPPRVASKLLADKTANTATAFVDGSPTLADVRLSTDGKIHSVAIVPGGNGSSSVFALDVTNTVSTTGTVTGPTPLWEILPGDDLAGLSKVKPAIARVKIAGAERFIAILATGLSADNPSAPYTKGRDVLAVDVTTGARMWRFKAACPITSDPVVFETQDPLETGSPRIDGYADRVILADVCGNVYKLNPAVELTGSGTADGWIDSTLHASIATGTTDAAGRAVKALFSTKSTSGAIGAERPVAGTVGTRSDASGRVILFFGTGGLESYDPTKQNEFYAVYADSGAIRNKITGQCTSGTCEKFYGGVAVSTDQVLLTRAYDPPIGTSSCALGKAEVDGVDIDSLATELAVTTTSATVSALFGHAGAVYFTTLGGSVVRVGTPVAANAGGESSGEGSDDDDGGGAVSDALGVMGWRQVK
jgi:hypothetical protein